MEVKAWDTVFVRARRRDVHRVLAAVDAYGQWWPGLTVDATTADPSSAQLSLRPPRRMGGKQRLRYTVTKLRADLGVDFAVSGDAAGKAEWYYLDERDGVVVAYLAALDVPARGARRWLAGHRAVVRAGLERLKDSLEAGRIPGAEPDAELLADQATAIAEFRARAEVWARKQAAREATAEAAPVTEGAADAGGPAAAAAPRAVDRS